MFSRLRRWRATRPRHFPPHLSKQDEFARHGFHEGYPLWNPDPILLPQDRQDEGLEIGDIGIVDRDGYFTTIFNVYRPPDPALALATTREPEIVHAYETFDPGYVFSSPKIPWRNDGGPVSYYTGPEATNDGHMIVTQYTTFLFEDGAHIIVPQGATCSKLAAGATLILQGAAAKPNRRTAWFDFANEHLQFRPSTLFLITGVCKTCSWSLASFNGKDSQEVEVRCKIVEESGRLQLGHGGSDWAPRGRFSYKIGPPTERQGHNNQTIFIQSFAITPNSSVQSLLPQQVTTTISQDQFVGEGSMAARGSQRWSWRWVNNNSLLSSSQHTGGSIGTTMAAETLSTESTAIIQHIPPTTLISHPLEIINQYLLMKQPSANVVVTHDSVWITMLERGMLSKLQDLETVIDTLVSKQCLIIISNGVVYLRDYPLSLHHFDIKSPIDLNDCVEQDNEVLFSKSSSENIYQRTLCTPHQTKVSMKVIKIEPINNSSSLEKQNQVQHMIEVWSEFDHANVLPLIWSTEDHGQFTMMSPWTEKGTLTSYLESMHRELTDVQILTLVNDVASGLHYLHSKDIIYGGLSGSNISINMDGMALLSEFSYVTVLDKHTSTPPLFSWLKPQIDTLQWAAPESLGIGKRNLPKCVLTKESDIYSFGGIMLQIFSGKVPYHFYETKEDIIAAISRGDSPQRPDDPRLTDHQWEFMQQCWLPPEAAEYRPPITKVAKFCAEELAQVKKRADPGLPTTTPPIGEPSSGPPFTAAQEKGDVQSSRGDDSGPRAIKNVLFDLPPDLTSQVTKSYNRPFALSSFGDVYKGIWNTEGEVINVAIKTTKLYSQHDRDLPEVKQFRKQIDIWWKLNHKNVLPLLGIIRDPSTHVDIPAMVCPWVENGALTRYLKKNKNLTVAKRLALVSDVAHGLQYLHSQHIVHGDLSGSNVLVYADGRACIADFGLSMLTQIGISSYATTYSPGDTTRWMAPELLDPEDDFQATPTMQSDVYSFGCIMLQILTGKIPYHHLPHKDQVILAVAKGERPRRPDEEAVTDHRWQFIEWCLSPAKGGKPRPSGGEIIGFVGKELDEQHLNAGSRVINDIQSSSPPALTDQARKSGQHLSPSGWLKRIYKGTLSTSDHFTRTEDRDRGVEFHRSNPTTANLAQGLSRGKEAETHHSKPDSQLSNEDDESRSLARTEDGERETSPPKPNSTTTNVTMGQVNIPGTRPINMVEALTSVHDLTGQVTKSSNHSFASGSFGDIYKGYLNIEGETIDVAIKTYRLYVQDDEDLPKIMKRFRRELKVWLRLDHPNVLPLLGIVGDLGVNSYLPAMVCPWVENGALTIYLGRNKHLTVLQRIGLVSDVARGLQYLHSLSIVHGDLSGSNVLVYADGRACIADFGLSVLLTKREGSTFAMSRQGRGTARWTAPELFLWDDLVISPSKQGDVYSFGSIMLQILTGDIPYHYIAREEQVILAVGTGQRHKRPDQRVVTDDIWRFMEWCWSVDPAKPRPTGDQIVEFIQEDLVEILVAEV